MMVSYIYRCCHHKVMKFQGFFRKILFSRQEQESVLRAKRGKTVAESPSGRSPHTRRDLKNRRINEDAPAKRALPQIFSDAHVQTGKYKTWTPGPWTPSVDRVHGLGFIKIWTGSMDPLSWTGSMDPPIMDQVHGPPIFTSKVAP